ncbi:hypothetical protein ACB092_02G116200 [Castanea dentata]
MVDTIAANTSTTESSSSSQDSYNPNDPLFLHPRENPGAVLTSQPLIRGENYSSWARSMRKSLIAKNKLGFIDGSLTMSSPLVNSPTVIQAWIRADNMVGTWIINSISPRLQAIKTQILLMDPLPSVNKAHSLFIQEEMQRFFTNSVRVEYTVLATKSSGNNPKGKERPLCTHCGKLGQIVYKCYKLLSFPPGYKFKNKNVMAHQVSTVGDQSQGHYLTPNVDHSSVVAQAPAFTPNQYQQLLSLIGCE